MYLHAQQVIVSIEIESAVGVVGLLEILLECFLNWNLIITASIAF